MKPNSFEKKIDMVNNVLILVPGDQARGGITNYYQSLRKHFPKSIFYFKRGARNWPKRSNTLIESIRIFVDYLRFVYYLLFYRISLIQTTTAFYRKSVIRDGLFILIARMFGKKIIIFFHGWNDEFVHNLSGVSLRIFKYIYFKANALIDLSQQNVDYLRKLGYKKLLYLETTVVDEILLENIVADTLINERLNSHKKTILFLSRIEKEKGVYNLLEAYKELERLDKTFELVFAGDGGELENLEISVQAEKIPNVYFYGYVEGKQKTDLFKQASIFVFLSEFEGMPSAVLEAMAFGLPVITTNVGGIASVFKNKKNGILLDISDISQVVKGVLDILEDDKTYKIISRNNYLEAKNKFWSSKVASRMITIFNKVNSL